MLDGKAFQPLIVFIKIDHCPQSLFARGIVKAWCCECHVCMSVRFKYQGCSMFVLILHVIENLSVLVLITPDGLTFLLHLICFYNSRHVSRFSSLSVFLIGVCDPVGIGPIPQLNILTAVLLEICMSFLRYEMFRLHLKHPSVVKLSTDVVNAGSLI